MKMILNKKYLEDVSQFYRDDADRKISSLGDEPNSDEVMKINEEGANQALKNIAYLMALGPKKQFKMGITLGVGWRDGFTKSPLEKRKQERRKKNKESKISRRKNRRV